MKRNDLSRLQIRILLLVREEKEGRIATETLYDLVEEVRPTVDENGDPLDDDVDIYETSREEIGGLENGGLLATDKKSTLAMGASVLTKRGRAMAKQLLKHVGPAEGTLRELAEVVWEGGDPDHEWDADTIDEVAQILTNAGFRPAE